MEKILEKLSLPVDTKLPYVQIIDNVVIKIYNYRGEIRVKIKETSGTALEFIIKNPDNLLPSIEKLKDPWKYQKFVLKRLLECLEEFDNSTHPILESFGFTRVPKLIEENSLMYKHPLFPENLYFKYDYEIDSITFKYANLDELSIFLEDEIKYRRKENILRKIRQSKTGGTIKIDDLEFEDYQEILEEINLKVK